MLLKLRFSPKQIQALAGRYSYRGEDDLLQGPVPRSRKARQLTKRDLVEIGCWKSPRIRRLLEENDNKTVTETTKIALSANAEELRIEVLTVLRGVGWPVASVLLHLCHRDPYPVLDYRALWSVGVAKPPIYAFPFWWNYTEFCRQVADNAGVDMRTLDRALWQYSKENQD